MQYFLLYSSIFVCLALMVSAKPLKAADPSAMISKGTRMPVGICTYSGQLIADTADETIYYICIPTEDGGFKYLSLQCGPGGVYLPHPTNPACVEPEPVTEAPCSA